MVLSMTNAVGFYNTQRVHSLDPFYGELDPAAQKIYTLAITRLWNFGALIGYVPIFGTIVGIVRLIIFSRAKMGMENITPHL